MTYQVALSVTLSNTLDKILEIAKRVELTKGSEEDLKIEVEKILEKYIWSKLRIPSPKHEYPVDVGAYAKSYGRIDALYGLTIFEYKKPGTLQRVKERNEAIRKLREEYIPGLLKESWVRALISRAREKRLSPRIIGIIFDGYGVIFIEYHIETEKFVIDPFVDFYDLRSEGGIDYLRRIIRSVIATYRKKLDARVLATDFGYMSTIAKEAVKAFYHKLANPRSGKTKVLFSEWFKTISQAYPISGEELRKIAELYGFRGRELEEIDGVKLFYAIQTYYSLILKLLAAEVAARFHDSAASIYIRRLMEATKSSESLRKEMEFLESGMVYTWFGIRNFLEGEFFSWYLSEWDEEVFRVVCGIIEKLNEYDVEALTLDLTTARDVFKLLYEELVPRKEVRQKLGIYTTPDWLAELILDELGLNAENLVEMMKKGIDPLDLRILDPGVGTGTFLSLVIQRLAEYLRKYHVFIPPKVANEALRKITRNVVGFDIDALAVLTARTNYLIALAVAGLLEHKGESSIEIPIYLTNSIVTVEEQRDRVWMSVGEKTELVEVAKVPTVVDNFQIPLRMVKDGSILQLLTDLKECIENEYSFGHTRVWEVLKKYEMTKAETAVIKDLYNKLLELKKGGIDEVWMQVIKSHIVPALFKQSFDFVIGNPPWIAYRYIANPEYQAVVKESIKDIYRLVKDEHLMTHMEMATLFFIRSIDLYLKKGASIGFVMPRAIFSADQHDNFRRSKVLGVKYRYLKIIDCEKVEPLFYVPACAVIAKKGIEVSYPIETTVVEGKLPEDRHKVIPLNEALEKAYLRMKEGKLYLNEVGTRSFLDYSKIELHGRRSDYYEDFYQGATIVPQLCWFIDVVDTSNPHFVIVQTARRSKIRGKVKAEIGPLPVEREFVYGALTSAEVLPFCHLPPNIAVLPIEPTRSGYEILRRERAKQLGYPYLAKWLGEAEKIYALSDLDKILKKRDEKIRKEYDKNIKSIYEIFKVHGKSLTEANVLRWIQGILKDRGKGRETIKKTLISLKFRENEVYKVIKILDNLGDLACNHIYDWLDYQHKLTRQNPNIKYKIVYLRSGTHLASCIVINEPKKVKGCNLNGILIESTLYWFETNDYEEACFLAAIFNSSILNNLIKPLQSRGEFGERDIHKKPLEFPIPKFDPDNEMHRKLSELGREASERARRILPKLLKKFGYDKRLKERGCLMPQEVARLRKVIKEGLKDLIEEIDKLVMELFMEAGMKRDVLTTVRTRRRRKEAERSMSLDKFLKG